MASHMNSLRYHVKVNIEINYLSPLIQNYWLIRHLPAKPAHNIELMELNDLSQISILTYT